MIKTSMMFSAHTLHVLHVVLRDTLIVLIVLFIALFAWLKYGIHTERFTVGKFVVEGLYIKLDKKLTFEAKKIIIPESKAKPSFDKVDETFARIKYLLSYFDYIELNEIDFNNNIFKFIFADNILYISSDDYEIAGDIERHGNKLVAKVSLFYLKKSKVNIVGNLKYFLNKDRLETEGKYEGYGIAGHFAAFKEKDLISFAINSDEFTTLKTLTEALPIKEGLKSWISEKIVAKKYKLNSLVGKATINDNEVMLDQESLRADAILNDVSIYYKEGLAPVRSKEVAIVYKNRSLGFDLRSPLYKDRDLQGSKVTISNMQEGKVALLHLDLKVKSQIDPVVHKILKAYALNIPVTQSGKNVLADIKLTIPLGKSKAAKKHKIETKVDLHLGKGLVTINKTLKLPVEGGDIHYENKMLRLHNIILKEQWYAAKANGKVDLKKKQAHLKLQVKEMTLGKKKQTFFALKNKVLDVKIDYGQQHVSIPTLNADLRKQGKQYLIQLSDLKKIIPYLKNMDIAMDGGHLTVKTDDFKQYDFNGVLKRNACFFYDKGNICHTRIPCSGRFSDKAFIFNAFNNRLTVNLRKSLITVTRLNIDLKAFFKAKKDQKSSKRQSKTMMKKVIINAKKSKLRYGDYTLVTDRYRIIVSPNGNIDARGSLKGDKVKLIKKGKNLTVEAIRVHDTLLHPLINFKGLKNGRYTFKSYGDPDKVMHGKIVIEGGVMKGFKAYNNTLAFINTLPALATLHSPGYSKKGFTIKNGVAKYRKVGDKIFFDSIEIEGTSANFVGKGMIDLKKQTINMNIAIQTARELGKVVGSVPILGYILMGDDKSMTVGLKITGSLSKPVGKTSAAKEILKLPLDLIKRTLQSPGHLLNKKKKPIGKPKLNYGEPKVFNKVAP